MKKVKDHYYKKAKKEGYSARSVYKLQEINDKKHILKRGQKILELGAAPGSWSEYASKMVGDTGLIVGIDLKERTKQIGNNTVFIKGDVYDIQPDEYHKYAKNYSAVISDMAPATTGNKSLDHLGSVGLCEQALFLSLQLVKKNGYLLVKIFQGGDFQEFVKRMRKHYTKVDIIKPKSSRKESREIFILGTKKIEPPTDNPDW